MRERHLTENRWHEAEAVGQHGTLNDVELGQNFKGEKTNADDVKRLEQENDAKLLRLEVAKALEEAKSP